VARENDENGAEAADTAADGRHRVSEAGAAATLTCGDKLWLDGE